MIKKKSDIDKRLVLLIVLSVIYLSYWLLFANYMYSTFQSSYWDIGVATYVMYLHVHSIQYMGPLQYLVFFNHISPFSVLLVPLFALYQQPITLIFIQDAFLFATVILVYFVSLKILKNRNVAFALAFAFLINPGLRGLLFFDFHPEAFLPFFSILSFYYYFNGKRKYFLLSLVLLLSIYETSYVVAGPMLLALLAYELLYNSKKKEIARNEYKNRINILLVGIIVTVLAFILYNLTYGYIFSTYATLSNYSIPPITRLYINFIGNQLKSLSNPQSPSYSADLSYFLGGIGTPTLFLGFGASSLFSLIFGTIMYLPWLFEVFVIHNWGFASFSFEYYAYVLAGSFISAILGFIVFNDNKDKISKKLHINLKTIEAFIFASIFVFSIVFSFVGLTEINIYTLGLQSHPNVNYTQLNLELATIPKNASIMAQVPIAAHIFYIHNLELLPIYNKTNTAVLGYLTVYWFVPDYIIIDKNLSDYYYLTHYNLTNDTFNIYQYMGKNYTVYYNNSDLYIYKRIDLNKTQT